MIMGKVFSRDMWCDDYVYNGIDSSIALENKKSSEQAVSSTFRGSLSLQEKTARAC